MNELLSPKVYANTMLKLLKNNLVMGKLVSTTFKNDFKKVGDTIYVKRPPSFLVREGRIAQVQPVIVGEVAVKLDSQAGVDIEFTSVEEALTVDDLLMNETMNAEAAVLAQYIDTRLMEAVLEFPQWVGTPGTSISGFTKFTPMLQRADNLAIPNADRNSVLSIDDFWALTGSFTTNNFVSDIAKNAIEKARLPLLGGVDAYKSQSVLNLTTGTRANGAINGAAQNVTYDSVKSTYTQSLIIDGVGAGATIKAGEVFTIANVYAINPATKQKQSFLAMFVNLTDAVADGGGAVTLTIQCPIIVGGAYATVDSAPADNAVVTWLGAASTSYPQNATFHKSAIQLAFAKLVMPRSGRASYSTDPDTGITIRYWETSDGTNDTHMHRYDVLFGVTNVDPRLGVRGSGS